MKPNFTRKPKMFSKYTKHQCVLLLSFIVTYMGSTIGLSLLGPFFPEEAEKKGITPSEYGFIFGIFYLVNFIACPICGKLLVLIDPTVIAKVGIFTVSVTTILFGSLGYLYNKIIFISLAYVLRIMEALGFASFTTASFSIIAAEYINDIGTVGAILETCLGCGSIIGPAVGGLLFEVQGFLLPFLVLGILVFCSSMVMFFFLQSSEKYFSSVTSSSTASMISVLKTPESVLALFSVAVACFTFGFFHATLEPHIRSLNLTPTEDSLMFAIIGVSYSCTTVAWGRICDRWQPPQRVWSAGAILICISMILMGPAPYLGIPLNAPLCCVSLAIMGCGQSAEIVSSFYCLNKVALKIGLPDDISTYALISSLFMSGFALGEFLGPTTGGFLLDSIGLPWGYHLVLLLHLLFVVSTILYCSFAKQNVFPSPQDSKKQDDINDKTPLQSYDTNKYEGY